MGSENISKPLSRNYLKSLYIHDTRNLLKSLDIFDFGLMKISGKFFADNLSAKRPCGTGQPIDIASFFMMER